MNIEEVGFFIGLIGLVLAALATFTITRLTTRMRISIVVAILLFGFIAMESMDIEFEAYGVRRCSGAAAAAAGRRG
jgi:FtsH-binding integral membrane protein